MHFQYVRDHIKILSWIINSEGRFLEKLNYIQFPGLFQIDWLGIVTVFNVTAPSAVFLNS